MATEPTIQCTDLVKRYGAVTAVDHVDLAVEPGEVFGFLGPNGSGKTTTLRVLAGLVTATSGDARVLGRAVPDPRLGPRVGCMIEEPAFYPWLTGRANLDILVHTGPPITASHPVDAVLDRVGLTEVADRKVKGYSQGMRQRLGLAAALIRDPEVLLLDEPTNGLDPAGIREFRALYRDLAAEGRTVFLSSHLLSEVERVCDRVAVVHRGRIAEQGRITDLVSTRSQVRVEVPDADRGRARELLGAWPVSVDGITRTLFVDAQDPAEVNKALAAGGVWATFLGLERPDLEAAYLNLTEEIA